MLNVVTLCGSVRKGSYNAMLARTLPALAPADMKIEGAPAVDTLPHYNADIQAQGFPAAVSVLEQSIRSADGVVIVTPEFNFSIPGVLKNALDWISRLPAQPFNGKPVLIQSVSQGLLGGVRAQYHLRQILVFLEASVFNRPEIMVGSAKGKFDEEHGELSDESARGLVTQQLLSFSQFVRHCQLRNG